MYAAARQGARAQRRAAQLLACSPRPGLASTARCRACSPLSQVQRRAYAKPANDGLPLGPGVPKAQTGTHTNRAAAQSSAGTPGSGLGGSPGSSTQAGSGSGSSSGGPERDWQPRRVLPLATAQTLTLFSTSPEALVLTLRSTLQGMLASLDRGASLAGQEGKPLEQMDARPLTSSPSSSTEQEQGKETAYTLLFALSKDLPSPLLAQAVGLLRGDASVESDAGLDAALSRRLIPTRVGVLSSAVPASLIPASALNPAAPPLPPRSTLHSAALSLLPSHVARAFRSKVKGKAQVQVGRWPEGKDAWKEDKLEAPQHHAEGGEGAGAGAGQVRENKADKVLRILDQARERAREGADIAERIAKPSSFAAAGGKAQEEGAKEKTAAVGKEGRITGWKALWGKENVDNELPPQLEALRAASVAPSTSSSTSSGLARPSLLSTILFTDPAPQGLLEGVESHFPHASSAGLVAPPTPFETGREQTLFFKTTSAPASSSGGAASAEVDEIDAKGAVGIALVGNLSGAQAQVQSGTAAQVAEQIEQQGQGLKVRTTFEALQPIGPRREITGARGNIISSLEGGNATQQFLRDIQAVDATSSATAAAAGKITGTGSTGAPVKNMERDEAREISKGMRKEDEFYLGIFDQREGGKPRLMARILSGHPSRGSLSVETDVDLEPLSAEDGGSATQQKQAREQYVQFYREDPELRLAQFPSALDIPGPNPGEWASPRFLFVTPSNNTTDDYAQHAAAAAAAAEAQEAKGEGKAKAQVLALPNMFIAASDRGWVERRSAAAPAGSIVRGVEQGKVTNVPGSSVMLSLVLEDEPQ